MLIVYNSYRIEKEGPLSLFYLNSKTWQGYYGKEKLQTNLSDEHRHKEPKQNVNTESSFIVKGQTVQPVCFIPIILSQ